ncbi:very long-chain specific acyl-CoA dehydrogenase, mitochondrial isoform X3 [Drosophila willistoni]|uniref:very long-chain specific acyl-CoA dehydrogenase, mitochondrial isoform X3 n=1 Tax=Drosophila willistoni TaxID=7260 RepID=UPI001F0715F4|nr:very long-chain specific acyl-CoA dehydrogenase, mitochondrial isoform X3 [Drosophila willistoni]
MTKFNNFVTKKLVSGAFQHRCFTAVSNTNIHQKHNEDLLPKPNESFMANIFRGSLMCKHVFPYPDVLTTEQKEFTNSLINPFERFFLGVNDAVRNDDNSKIDENTLTALWELGAFGIQVPVDYGGLGLNNTQYGRLCQIVGANDLGLGITIGAHQSIGFKGILLYGTPEQKAKYLPMVSSGKVYAAFALTEPSSGSDAGSIRCRAVKNNNYYILNGSKIWISNGGIADIMTVFAQTEQVDKKTGQKKDKLYGDGDNNSICAQSLNSGR